MTICNSAASLLVLLAAFTGCHETQRPNDPAPGSLSVDQMVCADGSGLVQFKARADGAVLFRFYFGEGPNTAYTSSDGSIAHTYRSSGSYAVQVLAYSKDSLSTGTVIHILVSVSMPKAPTGYTTPDHYPGMTLSWHDEFDGDHLDTASWNYETGGTGWGNHELEYYQPQNAAVHNGYLTITAKRESVGGLEYSSSRLTTQDKRTFQYGRIDFRAWLPKGQGVWPALWMLGSSIRSTGWPACGEVDIMEMIGGQDKDNTVYGTAHWDNSGTHASYGGKYGLSNEIFADQFHVFSVVWTSTAITWYVDDVQYQIIDLTPADLSELRKGFFLVVNLAIGGDWPGSPDGTTVFPQALTVDYVRVFQ